MEQALSVWKSSETDKSAFVHERVTATGLALQHKSQRSVTRWRNNCFQTLNKQWYELNLISEK